MKLTINMILVTLFVTLNCLSFQAQTNVDKKKDNLVLDKGVPPHKEIDEIYRQFNEGYKKLDPTIVANLYSESAAYLPPNSDIKVGRSKILNEFTEFFNQVKQENKRMEIGFRIVQREFEKNLAYDVGIYTLTTFNDKGESRTGNGKFVVVAKREKDKVWRFQVDGYNSLPRETK